jgi:hypothetical protein
MPFFTIGRGDKRMNSRLLILVLSLVMLSASSDPAKSVYPNRWVRIGTNLGDDQELERVLKIIQTASDHGLNGIALSAGLDQLDLKSPEFMKRLGEVRQRCAQLKVDIIPSFMSAGYGSSVLAHDKNLAAGLPVKDALFIVKEGQARLSADPTVRIENGSFEEMAGREPAGFSLPGDSAEMVFADTEVSKEGKTSLRFENSGKSPRQEARVSQEVEVHPYRCYVLHCWVRSQGLSPSNPFGSGRFRLEVLGVGDDRRLQYENPKVPAGGDWKEVSVGFNSWNYEKVRIVPTVGGGGKGRFWLDDLGIEEVGLTNVLRRPGTPLTVRGEENGIVYEENRDYAPVSDPDLNFHFDHEGPAIVVASGSRIREGERLRVSYWHGVSIYNGQVPICMSEPKLYEIWRTQARLVHEALAPEKYLLNMDEIRVGGSCEACRQRNLTMGQILGDCITKQFDMLRAVNPHAEIFVWSDMLDPNHNANPDRKYYYLAEGTFVDSWKYIPKGINIACWFYRMREKSLAFFSNLGFRTLGAAYYDADNLDNPRGWLEALDATPGACGIMYTTWLNKYDLLAAFGDLVSKR